MSHGFPNKYACCVETLLERRKEIDSFKVARFKPNSQRNLQPKNCKFTVTFQKFPHHLIGWCQHFRFRCCKDGSKRLAEGLTHIQYTWTLVCVSSWGKIDVQINEMTFSESQIYLLWKKLICSLVTFIIEWHKQKLCTYLSILFLVISISFSLFILHFSYFILFPFPLFLQRYHYSLLLFEQFNCRHHFIFSYTFFLSLA